VDKALAVAVADPDVPGATVAHVVDRYRCGGIAPVFVGGVRWSGKARHFRTVQVELDNLALLGRPINLVGAARDPAGLPARVGDPEVLLAVLLDKGDAVTLLERYRPGAKGSSLLIEDHDFGALRMKADNLT
jgi:hypothetical protein